jgi:hypothetical protein
MDKKLMNLKNQMNRTVLKDIQFAEKHMQVILKSIEDSEQQKSRYKIRMAPLLSFSMITILLVGMVYFVGIQTDLLEINLEEQNSKNAHDISKESFDNQIYIPSKQEENFKELSKETILKKMINSVDYFETAKGEFELYYSNSNTKMNVKYELSIRERAGGIVKTTINMDGESTTRSYSYKDVYKESSPLNIVDAFYVNKEGDQVTKTRWRPPIEEATNTLFPYEIVSNYTRNLTLWEIEKQNEILLGHNTLVIFGKLNDYAGKKSKSNTFRFWVDKDSGVLIKYETYNANGEVIDYLHPKKMKINSPVDTSKFK